MLISRIFARTLCTKGTSIKATAAAPKQDPLNNVKGLSSKCVDTSKVKSSPEYKVPEYYSYNVMSYHEAEVEMAKFRLPQPSSK